jgi:hypothetical protein
MGKITFLQTMCLLHSQLSVDQLQSFMQQWRSSKQRDVVPVSATRFLGTTSITIFENRLFKIIWPKSEELIVKWRNYFNEEPHNL